MGIIRRALFETAAFAERHNLAGKVRTLFEEPQLDASSRVTVHRRDVPTADGIPGDAGLPVVIVAGDEQAETPEYHGTPISEQGGGRARRNNAVNRAASTFNERVVLHNEAQRAATLVTLGRLATVPGSDTGLREGDKLAVAFRRNNSPLAPYLDEIKVLEPVKMGRGDSTVVMPIVELPKLSRETGVKVVAIIESHPPDITAHKRYRVGERMINMLLGTALPKEQTLRLGGTPTAGVLATGQEVTFRLHQPSANFPGMYDPLLLDVGGVRITEAKAGVVVGLDGITRQSAVYEGVVHAEDTRRVRSSARAVQGMLPVTLIDGRVINQ